MSERGIDAYRVASVLGYCLLPMVGIGAVSVVMILEYVVLLIMNTRFLMSGCQWAVWLPSIHHLHPVGHICSFRDIRRSSQNVRSEITRRLSYRSSLWLFRTTQHLQW
jgi:hypothetical protein